MSTVKIPYDTLEPTGLYTMPQAPAFEVAEVPREIYDTWTWKDSNELMELARQYNEQMKTAED